MPLPTSCLATFHWALTGTSLRWELWQPHMLEQLSAPSEVPCATPTALHTGNMGTLQGEVLAASSAMFSQPEFQDSSLHEGKTTSYHPEPASRLSHRRGDTPSPLYFTSLEHWFESSSSMSSQRHTAAGHGDDSPSSAEAELCISKVFPGLHRRGVLHPGG